jgi:hypothetical protein
MKKSLYGADTNVTQIKNDHRRELEIGSPCSWCASQVNLTVLRSLKF